MLLPISLISLALGMPRFSPPPFARYSECHHPRQWLSPEVLNAVAPKYDHRSDVFSYAVVFSELFMRQLPYSNYEEFVLRQEHALTEEQLTDEALINKLKSDGLLVDLDRSVFAG